MRHFQYRICEQLHYNGKKTYIVQWRDDWFGTGKFLFSCWHTIVTRSSTQMFFYDYVFDTLEDARNCLKDRKHYNEQRELEKIKKENIINY